MKKDEIDLSKYEEDFKGWFYWELTDGFGTTANPYDLNHVAAVRRGEFKRVKRYVKMKKDGTNV